MCWSAKASLQSFLIGLTFICLSAAYGAPLPLLFFCLTITFMQFIEYIVWLYYDNKQVNNLASIAAATLLWIQPIASMSLLPSSQLRTNAISLYIIFSLLELPFVHKKDYSMRRAENGHLAWNWITNNVYTYVNLFFYFLFLLGPILINGHYKLLLVSLGTLGISLYTFVQHNTWGSMWCWIVNILVILISGLTILDSKSR